MVGANNASAVATLVERVSRHTLVVPLSDGYTADRVARAISVATTSRACRPLVMRMIANSF